MLTILILKAMPQEAPETPLEVEVEVDPFDKSNRSNA